LRHLCPEMEPQTSKRQQVGLDAAEEIAGHKVENSHDEHPIAAG
jgi:hypothetical protein